MMMIKRTVMKLTLTSVFIVTKQRVTQQDRDNDDDDGNNNNNNDDDDNENGKKGMKMTLTTVFQ